MAGDGEMAATAVGMCGSWCGCGRDCEEASSGVIEPAEHLDSQATQPPSIVLTLVKPSACRQRVDVHEQHQRDITSYMISATDGRYILHDLGCRWTLHLT